MASEGNFSFGAASDPERRGALASVLETDSAILALNPGMMLPDYYTAASLPNARNAPGFTMQFPGAACFTDFAEPFLSSRQRCTSVHKSFDRVDIKDG